MGRVNGYGLVVGYAAYAYGMYAWKLLELV